MPYPCPDCCGDCIIDQDNFDRADDTDIGAKWTEQAGDPEIASNRMLMTDANTITLLDALTPDTAAVEVTANIYGANNTQARVGVDYVDANNYYFAEFNIHATTGGYVKLYKRAGGSNTLLVQTFTLGPVQMLSGSQAVVCFSNGVFAAHWGTILSNASVAVSVPTTGSPRQVFIGTGATVGSGIEFDNVVVKRGKSDEAPSCPPCVGPCTSICPDDELETIEWEIETDGYANDNPAFCDITHNCAFLNDLVTATFWKTTYETAGGGAYVKVCWWRYLYPSPVKYCDDTTNAFDLTLYGRALSVTDYGVGTGIRIQVFGLDIDADTTHPGGPARIEAEDLSIADYPIDCDTGEYSLTPSLAGFFRPAGQCDVSTRTCVVRVAA